MAGETSPTVAVIALSACRPPTHTPTSTLTMSPSTRTRLLAGMPWTTSALIEVQSVAGNP